MRLEPFADEHLPSLDVLLADPLALRFTRIPEPPPPGFARGWLDSYEEGRREGSREAFAALDDDGAFVGLALAPDFDREAAEVELGYIVVPQARGRGVATAMLRALTSWAFEQGAQPGDAHHRRRQRGVRAGRGALRLHPRGRDARGPSQGRAAERRQPVVAAVL